AQCIRVPAHERGFAEEILVFSAQGGAVVRDSFFADGRCGGHLRQYHLRRRRELHGRARRAPLCLSDSNKDTRIPVALGHEMLAGNQMPGGISKRFCCYEISHPRLRTEKQASGVSRSPTL